MKRISVYLIAFVFMVITIVMTYYNVGMDNIILVAAGFLIGVFALLFEIRSLDARKVAAIAALSALGGVLRVPFAAIPGLQPTTFITAVAGYTLGPVNGFMVGGMAAFISNFFLGQGPWTLWQMLGWGLCGVFFGVLKNIMKRDSILLFAIICGIWGYIFGIILDMWYIVAFIKPMNWGAIIAGIAASLSFDTIHSIGNVLFSLLLGKNFIKTLERFNKRYNATIYHMSSIIPNIYPHYNK
jgi:energy-coupling factor transport system substrate-specific component